MYDEQSGEEREVDLVAEISSHLADGEVAILQEVGAEKLRYLTGYSIAVNSLGQTFSVDIDDIYQKVRDAGWSSTPSTVAF